MPDNKIPAGAKRARRTTTSGKTVYGYLQDDTFTPFDGSDHNYSTHPVVDSSEYSSGSSGYTGGWNSGSDSGNSSSSSDSGSSSSGGE